MNLREISNVVHICSYKNSTNLNIIKLYGKLDFPEKHEGRVQFSTNLICHITSHKRQNGLPAFRRCSGRKG